MFITSFPLLNGKLVGDTIFRRPELTCGDCAIRPIFVELPGDHATYRYCGLLILWFRRKGARVSVEEQVLIVYIGVKDGC